MTSLSSGRVRAGRVRGFCFLCLPAAAVLVAAATYAQDPTAGGWPQVMDEAVQGFSRAPVYIIPGKPEIATLYFDGSQIEVQTDQRWSFMCGSDLTGLTVEDLKAYAEAHLAALEGGPAVIVDDGTRDGGLDVVFYADGSVPSDALNALATTEAYLETLFADDIVVPVNVSFQSMGSGVLGSTGVRRVSGVTYEDSRNGLQSGMDGDDVIQSWLPSGSTVPVRYNGSSGTVTNENRLDWARAAFNATVGANAGIAADATFNTQVSWDYDPANGINLSRYSFVDVALHESGHGLGFLSAADNLGESMEAMDLFRFQETDGGSDYNPDTYAEFQTTPRLVDYNNPEDAHNSDLIDFEYRMSDGDPYQASHFRQQSSPWIGLMDPAIANGETHYPDYFSAADKNMFDAVGYDHPRCQVFFISQPEPSQTACEGDLVIVSVSVEDPVLMTFQWRRGTTELVDDGAHIFGATTDTLMIMGFSAADQASDYNCAVTNTFQNCTMTSADAEVLLDPYAPLITQQPQDQTAVEGDLVMFNIAVEEPLLAAFQWRKGGSPLSDDGHYVGTTTDTLLIPQVALSDAGEYDCVVTSLWGAECSTTSDTATLTVHPAGNDCPEDLNGDDQIGLADLAILLANYGQTDMGPEDGDFDGDGDVDLADLSQLLAVYGQDCPTQP